MTSNYIWDYGTTHECVATEEEFDRIMKDIHYEFVRDGEKIQYSHKDYRGYISQGNNHEIHYIEFIVDSRLSHVHHDTSVLRRKET
jgi:hypothetical protein